MKEVNEIVEILRDAQKKAKAGNDLEAVKIAEKLIERLNYPSSISFLLELSIEVNTGKLNKWIN